ncbi:MAG: bifunctional DNA-formamidopyrimidine glycosylase/DNA-(apurinic or apyrimidinic site) lyase [Candidatus Saccharibacteria bacterium]
MPELPEVETVTRSLQVIKGQSIEGFEVSPLVLRLQEYLAQDVVGQKIRSIERRGKFIVMSLSASRYLVVHLGMSGRLFLSPPDEPLAKHTHAVLTTHEKKQVRYFDPRRFGGVWLTFDPVNVVGNLGPEPLSPEFTEKHLTDKLSTRKIAIKSLLLDQQVLAGVGNIYADEALHRAGIKPDRPANSLTRAEISRLYKAIIETLQLSIEKRGTTFRDYRDGLNQPGGFQDHLLVYGREGKPCHSCGRVLRREVIGGRSSHYCEHCQK